VPSSWLYNDYKYFFNRIGIIGEPLNQFNEKTLTPLGADAEDEENEEDGKKQ